jgi:subtilisin family serine protease
MNIILSILLLVSPYQFYRAPQAIDYSKINEEIVWVYFTDKGFKTEKEYQKILREYEPQLSTDAIARRIVSMGKVWDFDDLPVYRPYLEEIMERGGKLRVVSNWLNAASFYLAPELLPQIASLPFVYDIKPVAQEKLTLSEIQTLEQKSLKGLDTSYYRELYNLTYEQNSMLGVPPVFKSGFTGSGIKLAILDTGLKRRHNALRSLRILKEHDFLSGDDIIIKLRSGECIAPSGLKNIKMLKALELIKTTNNRLFVFYTCDSFTQTQPRPPRLVMSYSNDQGRSWSWPQILFSSHTYNISLPTLKAASKDSVVYLVWQELIPQAPQAPVNNLYFNYLINTNPQTNVNLGTGKNPALFIKNHLLALSYVEHDSILYFRSANIANIIPSFASSQQVYTFNEAIGQPLVIIDSLAEIEIFVRGLRTQNLYHFTSSDGGTTFNLNPLLDSSVGPGKIFAKENRIYLIYKQYISSGKTNLILRRSNNGGLTWDEKITVLNNTLALGEFSLFITNDTLWLAYESQNNIYLQISTDNGTNWAPPQIIAQNFAYYPQIITIAGEILISYLYRGDDNTDYEEDEDFSEQPNHGTHMASIIAGYLPKIYIGVAPGVSLIIAKTELHRALSGYTYETIIEEDLWISGLEWAEKEGAQIISSSLGYRSWYTDKDFDGKTIPVSLAAGLAAKRGVVVVSAMGNAPQNYFPWPSRYIVAPGDAFDIITAGGVKKDSTPWRSTTSATGIGPTYDGRIKPDLVALSDGVVIVNPDSADEYLASSGTSCATALIAGLCALVLEAHPHWNADSVKQALFSTASLSTQSCTLGWGIPNVESLLKRYPSRVTKFTRNILSTPYPSPWNPTISPKIYFPFYLMNTPRWAELRIYTLAGELIKTIPLAASKINVPGRYLTPEVLSQIGAFWDGKNNKGNLVSSGLYFIVLETSFGRDYKIFTLVR